MILEIDNLEKQKQFIKNIFQMNLETVIQNEVSHKEKNKYRMLTHICGI